jgi:hypothetical protein
VNTTYEILAITGLVIILLLFCFFEHIRIVSYESKITAYQIEIETLHQQSVQANERMSDSIKQANDRMTILEAKANKILTSKIPSDCPKAIQWAIQQSANFR